jgi:hypothetical protein
MSLESQKRKELQKLIDIVKSNFFLIFNGKPYIYYKKYYYLCSLQNIEYLAEQEAVFYLINRLNYKTFINRIFMYHSNKIYKKEEYLNFKNILLNVPSMKGIREREKSHPYFLNINLKLEPKEKIEFKYIHYFLKNMAKADYEQFIILFSKILTIKNDITLILKSNKESQAFIKSFLEKVFESKYYEFLNENSKINTDTIYEKNVLVLNSSLLKNRKILNCVRRNLIEDGSIVHQEVIFRGMSIIYCTSREEVEYATSKIKEKAFLLELYNKNHEIKFSEEHLNEELIEFIIYLLKFNKEKVEIDIENSINEKDILKDWLTRKLDKIQKLRKELNKENIYFNYKNFCNFQGMTVPLKSTFNFYLKSINNEISYTGNMFIKSNKELLSKNF